MLTLIVIGMLAGVDATGTLRYVTFGEGDNARTETLIRQLPVVANPAVVLPPPTTSPPS